MIIDAHHHLWRYNPEEFAWIDEGLAALRRDFLPADLAPVLQENGVGGSVVVQARQTVEETRWLLQLAGENPLLRGVVGWVPLAEDGVGDLLAELARDRRLRGVRHIVQAEPDGYLLRDDFNRGVDHLKQVGLAYDLLIAERQLPEAIHFVDRHPNQVFILDHIAKPRIREAQVEPWSRLLHDLAERPNVYCKVSGLVTEADLQTWSAEQFAPYLEAVLHAFGPRRLMFGSDWPVCLAAADYEDWIEVVQIFASLLSESEQERLWAGTAIEAYGLRFAPR